MNEVRENVFNEGWVLQRKSWTFPCVEGMSRLFLAT